MVRSSIYPSCCPKEIASRNKHPHEQTREDQSIYHDPELLIIRRVNEDDWHED